MGRLPVPTFCDIEASALKDGWPVEVGWSRWPPGTDSPRTGSVLIRPHPQWTGRLTWSAEAEAVHGISRDRLEQEGLPAEQAARAVVAGLAGLALSDAPDYDSQWLTQLMVVGNIAMRDQPRLIATESAFSTVPPARLRAVLDWADATLPLCHRAGPDAERWARIWQAVSAPGG